MYSQVQINLYLLYFYIWALVQLWIGWRIDVARLTGVSEEEEEEDAPPPPLPTAAATATFFFGIIALLRGGRFCAAAVRDAELLVLLLKTRNPCFVREDAISLQGREAESKQRERKRVKD